MDIKVSLIDNDYVICTKTDFHLNGEKNRFAKFFQEIDEELIPGKTAHLQIEGFGKKPVTFEISKTE